MRFAGWHHVRSAHSRVRTSDGNAILFSDLDSDRNGQPDSYRHTHTTAFRNTTPNSCAVMHYMQLGMLERRTQRILPLRFSVVPETNDVCFRYESVGSGK